MAPKCHQLLRDGPLMAALGKYHVLAQLCHGEKRDGVLVYLRRLDAWLSHTRPLMASSAPGKWPGVIQLNYKLAFSTYGLE